MAWAELLRLNIYHGYILQILLAELMFVPVLKRRSHFALRAVCGFLVYGVASVIVSNFVARYVLGQYSTIIFLLSLEFMFFCFSNRAQYVLFCCVGAQLTQNLSHNIEALIYRMFEEYFNTLGWLCLSVAVMVLVYAACYEIFVRRLKENNEEDGLSNQYIFPIAIAAALFCYIMQYLLQAYNIDQMWVTKPPLIICDLFALSVQFELVELTDERAKRRLLERMIQKERQQYETAKENMDLLNQKAHDLKYQISRIRAKQCPDDADLEEMEQIVERYEQQCDTGSPALDVVVTEKQMVCQKEHIQFTIIAEGKSLHFINDADLVSLMGNALDNAIECEQKVVELDKRCIALNIFSRSNLVCIRVENYCPMEMEIRNGQIRTSKQDLGNHGFGLPSMKYITQKYGGSIQMSKQNDLFVVTMLFPTPEE